MDGEPEGGDGVDPLQKLRKLLEDQAESMSDEQIGSSDPYRHIYMGCKVIAQLIGDTTVRSWHDEMLKKCAEADPAEFDRLVEDYERKHGVSVLEKIDQFFEEAKAQVDRMMPPPDAAEDIIRDIHAGNPGRFWKDKAAGGEENKGEGDPMDRDTENAEDTEDVEDTEEEDAEEVDDDPPAEENDDGGEDDDEEEDDGEWEGWRFDDDEDEDEEDDEEGDDDWK
jgi:hypothetical protein